MGRGAGRSATRLGGQPSEVDVPTARQQRCRTHDDDAPGPPGRCQLDRARLTVPVGAGSAYAATVQGAGDPERTDTGPPGAGAGWQPPPLPRRLTDPVLAIAVGASAWGLALLALGVLALLGTRPADAWLVACAVGLGLGALGVGVLTLQRRANRRGDKGAQRL